MLAKTPLDSRSLPAAQAWEKDFTDNPTEKADIADSHQQEESNAAETLGKGTGTVMTKRELKQTAWKRGQKKTMIPQSKEEWEWKTIVRT